MKSNYNAMSCLLSYLNVVLNYRISLFVAIAAFSFSCYNTQTVTKILYNEAPMPDTEEVETVEYSNASQAIFNQFVNRATGRVVNLAVFDFWSYGEIGVSFYQNITNNFFNTLVAFDGVFDKIQPSQPENVRIRFNTAELNHRNIGLLNQLHRNDIGYVVTGKVIDAAKPEFELSVYRTSDGKPVITSLLKTTTASCAYQDGARLIVLEQIPEYGSRIDTVGYRQPGTVQVGQREEIVKELNIEKTVLTVFGAVAAILLIMQQF